MITTQAQVNHVNQALRSLGEKPIALPYDETNPRWLLAQEFYDQTQDALHVEHFWNFATMRAVLAPALDETNRRQFRGCIEDWVIDHVRINVTEMTNLG